MVGVTFMTLEQLTGVRKMRKRKSLWTLLYKKDGNHKVWIYEKLRRKEIAGMLKNGWREVK